MASIFDISTRDSLYFPIIKYVLYRIRRRSYVGVLAVRYVFESDITERYLLSEYACSISANVGILTVVSVAVAVDPVHAVTGTIAVSDFGSRINVLGAHANGLFPLLVL
jgi:hypothetical protein